MSTVPAIFAAVGSVLSFDAPIEARIVSRELLHSARC